MDELRVILLNIQYDCVCITESWLNCDMPDCIFNIPDFIIHRHDRKGRIGGGVCVWSSTNNNCVRFYPSITFPFNIEIVFLILKNCKLLLCTIYIPPSLNITNYNDINTFLISATDEALIIHPDLSVAIIGDLNKAPLTDVLMHCALSAIITVPTRGDACLDQLLVDDNYKDNLRYEINCPIGKSDHSTIIIKDTRSKLSTTSGSIHKVFDFRENNINAFISECDSIDFNIIYNLSDIDDKANCFALVLKQALLNSIPFRTVLLNVSDKAWMTGKVKMLINDRWKAFRVNNMPLYNRLKIKVKEEIVHAKQNWVNKNTQNAKNLWNIIHNVTGLNVKSPISSLIKDFASKDDLASSINDYFKNNFQISSAFPDIAKLDDWNLIISEFDVLNEIIKLKRGIATPIDDIPARLYKDIAVIIAAPLCHIINQSIKQRYVPLAWKLAQVCPVPKSNSVQIDNLRPISVLNIPAKIAEKLVLKSVKDTFIDIYGTTQFAYRPACSTTCALIDVNDYVTRQLDSNHCCAVALVAVDFSKAFDLVDHGMLLKKLQHSQLPNDFSLWIKSYLTDRKQAVVFHGGKSGTADITSGVPQGAIFSAYLFGVFSADLQMTGLNSNVKMIKYADDTTLLVTINKNSIDSDLRVIKLEIENIVSWSSKNGMKINDSKCKLLYFRKNSPNLYILPPNIAGIDEVNICKLLGITFTNNLSFKTHFAMLIKKASQRLYFLRVLKKNFDAQKLWNIFFMVIRTLLEYAAPVFVSLPQYIVDQLEKLQRRAHFIICGLNCYKCSIPSLEHRRIIIALRLFDTIYNLPNHPLNSNIQSYINSRNHLILPTINTNYFRNTFFNQCVIIKNNVLID
jgi:hypothetical protein